MLPSRADKAIVKICVVLAAGMHPRQKPIEIDISGIIIKDFYVSSNLCKKQKTIEDNLNSTRI